MLVSTFPVELFNCVPLVVTGTLEMFFAVGKVVVCISVVFDLLVLNCVVLTVGLNVAFNCDVLVVVWVVLRLLSTLVTFTSISVVLKRVVCISVVFDWLVLNCVVLTAGLNVVLNCDVLLVVWDMLILRSTTVTL